MWRFFKPRFGKKSALLRKRTGVRLALHNLEDRKLPAAVLTASFDYADDVAMSDITGIWSDRDDISHSEIAEAWFDGKMITFSSNDDQEDLNHSSIVPDHAYVFVGYGANGNYIVYNPWGTDANGNSPFTTLTQEELEDNCDEYSWCG
jgi:hypothetical protein